MVPEAAQAMFDSLNRIEIDIGKFRDMSSKELGGIDPATLGNSQLDAYIERLRLND